MDRLSYTNPVFAAYAVAATIMIFKTIAMAWLTVYRMMTTHSGYRSPEDSKKTLLNPEPKPDQVGPNDYVDRVRRIHLNDLENVPFFLAAGLLYVLTDPSVLEARLVLFSYVGLRLLHFAAYLSARTHDTRATMWTFGVMLVMYMAGRALYFGAMAL
jgi:glutathione S-transferase